MNLHAGRHASNLRCEKCAQSAGDKVQQQLEHVNEGTRGGRFEADWDSLGACRVPDWYRDAKLGIFIHWGVYSVPAFGNEWYPRNMYQKDNAAFQHHIDTNGEAVYGSRPWILFGGGPTKVSSPALNTDKQEFIPEDIRFMTHDNVLYTIAMGWLANSELQVHTLWRGTPHTDGLVCSVDLLGS